MSCLLRMASNSSYWHYSKTILFFLLCFPSILIEPMWGEQPPQDKQLRNELFCYYFEPKNMLLPPIRFDCADSILGDIMPDPQIQLLLLLETPVFVKGLKVLDKGDVKDGGISRVFINQQWASLSFSYYNSQLNQ